MADSQGLIEEELSGVNIEDLENDDDEHMTPAEVCVYFYLNYLIV